MTNVRVGSLVAVKPFTWFHARSSLHVGDGASQDTATFIGNWSDDLCLVLAIVYTCLSESGRDIELMVLDAHARVGWVSGARVEPVSSCEDHG